MPRPAPKFVVAACAAALVAALSAASPSAQRGSLTGAAQIARVYDAIFDARFEQVPTLLGQTCPPAPGEVCILLDTVTLWWQIQLDPENRSRDSRFAARVEAAIAAVEAWTEREPQRAEAWFYLGGAYGARAQFRVLRGETLAAARDGKRIKGALEQSLALDPALQDAYFGIGLYHYYADVAPAAAKVLRFLLALPGGDKVEGMQEMLRARSGGQLLRDEADYQLHLIDLWYEHQPERALERLRGLRDRHPRNPHFYQLIAQVEDVYLHDPSTSARAWQALLDAEEDGRIAMPDMAEAAARLGLAQQLDVLYETDRAIDHLRAVIAAKPAAPAGAVARARQLLSRMEPRLNARTDAARAYRLSLEGWRAFERGDYDEASRAIAQAVAMRPMDQVMRYRQARLLEAQHSDAAALSVYESIIRNRDTTPAPFYANACVDAARLYEQRDATTRAIDLYRLARTVFGADQRTKDAAQRALARLAL